MRRLNLQLLVVISTSIGAVACGESSSTTRSPAAHDPVTDSSQPAGNVVEAEENPDAVTADVSRWPAPLAALDPTTPANWTVDVIAVAPHDPDAFTQGLEPLADGRLLESTGLRGRSEIRIVEPSSGDVIVARSLEPEQFGEGVTVVNDTVVQLTWQEGKARRWSLPELEPLDSFTYDGEGWGLCRLGDRLAMSDGTSVLQWRDATTFALLETVPVTMAGQPVDQLNELECVDGHVVANIWRSEKVVVIEPSGPVVAIIDAGPLVDAIGSDDPVREVLNGVAAHPNGTFSMTGKRWPIRFVVRVVA